jgi:hypothetical protein
MLSVVMAGRNDSYGFKPLERATHAINQWAMELRDTDEIIFVDENTPNDRFTLPEMIKAHLSTQARSILRVLRIRPETHEAMGVQIPMAEYHAKNTGIKFARGHWVACTNTDTFPIGMPRPALLDAQYLYQAVAVKHIPVVDWIHAEDEGELLDCAGRIRERGIWKPGDFQLAHRDLWLKLMGYDEDLLYWGYNDSLLVQKAQHLTGGAICDIGPSGMKMYHLNHKTAQCPARGWYFKRNIDEMPELSKRVTSTNQSTWGLWEHEEVML